MLCTTCAYQYDLKNCARPEFGEVIECGMYVSKANYKNTPHHKGYIIPYNFPLNTRKGFNAIYGLMKLTRWNMANVIMIIINARRKASYVILRVYDKIEKENNDIIKFLYGGA